MPGAPGKGEQGRGALLRFGRNPPRAPPEPTEPPALLRCERSDPRGKATRRGGEELLRAQLRMPPAAPRAGSTGAGRGHDSGRARVPHRGRPRVEASPRGAVRAFAWAAGARRERAKRARLRSWGGACPCPGRAQLRDWGGAWPALGRAQRAAVAAHSRGGAEPPLRPGTEGVCAGGGRVAVWRHVRAVGPGW